MNTSYKTAGVDIDAGNALVERIKPLAKATHRQGVVGGIGGFAGAFALHSLNYQKPVLLASTDGVGTKVKIAIETGLLDGIGIDLVAMCVNDLVVAGAEPLFFLDYYATSHLSVDNAARVIASIAKGCTLSGCALLGGETAEMPGMYGKGDFDLAGFAVGVAEADRLLDGSQVKEGDILVALPSSGVHANGFSLIRHIIEREQLSYQAPAPFMPHQTLGEALLTPTTLYVKPCLDLLRAGLVHGLVHITGGGFTDNIPRILSDNLNAHIDLSTFTLSPVFQWLKKTGGIQPLEMLRTFNCGVGMVVVMQADRFNAAKQILETHHHIPPWIMGRIDKRQGGQDAVIYSGIDALFA
jgi:phosphoribosylformylglycinamidine cyclo-ligase